MSEASFSFPVPDATHRRLRVVRTTLLPLVWPPPLAGVLAAGGGWEVTDLRSYVEAAALAAAALGGAEGGWKLPFLEATARARACTCGPQADASTVASLVEWVVDMVSRAYGNQHPDPADPEEDAWMEARSLHEALRAAERHEARLALAFRSRDPEMVVELVEARAELDRLRAAALLAAGAALRHERESARRRAVAAAGRFRSNAARVLELA